VHPLTPEVKRVKRVKRENHNTVTLTLEGGGGFLPGQFNMLYAFGVGEVPISFSGDPDKDAEHTVRDVGAVTRALAGLKRGARVGVRGPFGSAWPLAACRGRDVVLMAGGIGLAPLRPVIYQLLKERDRYGEIALLYGARTRQDLLYAEEFERWRGRFGVQVRVTVDSAGQDWKGNVGVVTSLLPRVRFDPAHATAMICGPEVMMRFSVLELKNMGLKNPDIHVTLERNMKCAVGFCGHCQYGSAFICKDGPVFSFDRVQSIFQVREL